MDILDTPALHSPIISKLIMDIMDTNNLNEASNICDQYVGKYVIVRSRNEGINAGTVLNADATGIILKNARRLWYHRPADGDQSWYEGVANTGLRSDSKISAPVAEKAIIEDYSITVCTTDAEKSIQEFPIHAQS